MWGPDSGPSSESLCWAAISTLLCLLFAGRAKPCNGDSFLGFPMKRTYRAFQFSPVCLKLGSTPCQISAQSRDSGQGPRVSLCPLRCSINSFTTGRLSFTFPSCLAHPSPWVVSCPSQEMAFPLPPSWSYRMSAGNVMWEWNKKNAPCNIFKILFL